ncbi:hypothetical protein PAEPH01_1998, partial [Pancytospora epiphaga]
RINISRVLQPKMKYNTHKMLHVAVSIMDLQEECGSMAYAYAYKEEKFTDSFCFVLPELHDMLFESLVIVFRNKNRKMIGISKLPLKQFLEAVEKPYENFVPVLSHRYYGRAEFHEETVSTVGRIRCKFTISKRADENNDTALGDTGPNDIFGFLFAKDKAEMYRVAYELFKSTQKGTFLCKIRWIIGIISAEYYYNNAYGKCQIEDCDGTSCEKPFCKASYGALPQAELESAAEMFQYAAASFGNSLVTWRLEKRRKLTGVLDGRKRAILERLDIEESDLIVDDRGSECSLSYIAFFSKNRLVLSFKGTTNGSEAMHDLNCRYVEFQNGYAHRGIKSLAERFLSNCWESLYASMVSRGVNKLVLTGQSLGAAASLLVYLVMQERCLDRGLSVEVTCFAAPPVVSASIADRSFPNIRVYNYGHDIITRLCFGSVLDLKYLCISISSLYDYFTDKKLIVQKIDEIKGYLRRNEINTKLYIPGTLVHILDCGTGNNPAFGYKQVNYRFFEDIVCTRRAPFDHIIHRTHGAFKYSMESND